MARVRYMQTLESVSGQILVVKSGAPWEVRLRGSATPVTFYATDSGGTGFAGTTANLITRTGRVEPVATVAGELWLDSGTSYDEYTTANGLAVTGANPLVKVGAGGALSPSVESSIDVTLRATGVAATDTAAVQAALITYAYQRRVVPDPADGDFSITPGVVVMPDGGHLAGRPGAKFVQASRQGGNVGLITIPDGAVDFVVEDLELEGMYSGSGVRTNPANSGVWTKGAARGRISNCVAHHFDFSGFFNGVSTVTDTPGDLTIENCTGHSNGVDGCETNTSAAATGAQRITITNFRAYNNRFYGVEVTGDLVAARHIVLDKIFAWENDIAGVSVDPGVAATIENVVLGEIHAWDNLGVGVSLASLRVVVFSSIIAHGNVQEGVSMSDVIGLAGGVMVLDGNDRRALLINGGCKHISIDRVVARTNGATASAGMAAVEINSTGAACEDVQIGGMDLSDNVKEGLYVLGLLRGRFDGSVNTNAAGGARFEACNRVRGDLTTLNNTTTGLVVSGASADCVIDLITGDTGGGAQTTGWSVSSSSCTDIMILEHKNNCATARLDSGTRTRRVRSIELARRMTRASVTPSAGTVTITSSNAEMHYVTLNANATVVNVSAGDVDGDELEIQVIQDATGSRTFAWPSNLRYAGGAAPAVATAASNRDIVRFRWDGSLARWREVSRSLDIPT